MKRVLEILVGGIGNTGISMLVYNYCFYMNKENIEIDFLSANSVDIEFKNKFKKIGKVIELPDRKKNLLLYIRKLKKILKNNDYDIVHIHGNSGTMGIESLISKISGIKKIIVHSHNTECGHPVLNKILNPVMKKTANVYLSCSEAAGEWLFGKNNYTVLNNAINLEKFRYNEKIRNKYRQDFNIKENIVIGHVGRINKQKNQEFLLDVFYEIHRRSKRTKLMLVGDGPLEQEIKEKIIKMDLENDVLMLGMREDANNVFQAMDIFVFPSLFEGLGISLIEAQTSGLRCFASDKIPAEANATDTVLFYSLNLSKEIWAENILNNINYVRKDNFELLKNTGFNIKNESEKLKKIYIK